MITICKIDKYNTPRIQKRGYIIDNYYSVWLPNDKTLYFKSKRKTQDFIRKANKEINLIAHELINNQTEIENLFWKKVQSGILYRNVQEEINESAISLTRLITHTKGPNGTYFIFKFLNQTVENQKKALLLLSEYEIHYSRNLEVMLNKNESIKEQISNIGNKTT